MKQNSTKKYRNLRAALYRRGLSIRQFAILNELPLRTVYGAASGERSGVKSAQILTKLEQAARAQIL